MPAFDLLAFDADDTLWQNERLYADVQARFARLLARYHPEEWVWAHLFQAETRNLEHFGYGVKAFALSMIETAVELTGGEITGQDLRSLIELARGMLQGPIELLEGVEGTLRQLEGKYD